MPWYFWDPWILSHPPLSPPTPPPPPPPHQRILGRGLRERGNET